jgi:hypothetical protein
MVKFYGLMYNEACSGHIWKVCSIFVLNFCVNLSNINFDVFADRASQYHLSKRPT